MGRGTYYHAIILPVSCYAAELERSAREWNRKSRIEALYNSDDLARHMANHVMNQNPALSVTHISTPDLIPRGLWRDPYRIYATLFSQASRVLFLVTESDQDEFEDFFENHLLNFFERLRGHRSFREWNTRFIVVVMGEFELPAILCCENPPCEVVRFHEIGWFRDSVALMLLYQKIRDYWIPPSQTGAHDEKALPHATFEQPSGDFPAVLEETETTQTAITIKNSVSSTIDGVQESSIRQIIREVGEPSDYSESPSDSSISPFNEAAEKADQFVKSSGQEQWHFIAQQTFNMIIEKENRKKYDISNPSGKIACPLCSSAKDYKRRSLEMSKSETHLYRKKNLWPHGGEMQERSEDTSSQSTGYPGISGVFKQSKSPESPKSNSSHLRKPSIFESGDKQLCLSPLERRTTDLNLTSCGSEKTPGDRTFLSEEKTQENKNESEAGEAMKPFSLKPSSPMQCHLPTAPPITERSGCQLMPDTFTQERENVGSASPNLEDVGQNENSLLSKKHDVVKGEQLGSDLPEAFQAMDKYADPKGTKMGPGSTHKSDAVVNSLGQYQAAEGLERGTHEQPKANYLHPQENPHAECPLAYKRSNSTVDEYMTLGKHKALNRATDKAEEGSRYLNRAEDMKSYSQKAEVDFRTDIERQEHEHSAESTVHANEHTQDERYSKVHSLEETGLHRQKSMDDKDTESRIAVYAKEEDEQERIKVAVFGSSLSGQSAFLTAEYYPGKQRGLPDMTEENEGEESSKGVGGTMAASISNSGGCGKPSSKPFSDPSHPSDDETMKNFNIMQNVSLKEEQASSSIGAERYLESFVPISLGQLRNGSDAILVNHVSMLSSVILPPNLTSVRKPESGRPDFLQKIIPDNATGSIKSFHKTPEDDIMLEPINEAERKFGETAQFMKKEFGDTSVSRIDKRTSGWHSQEDKAVRNESTDNSMTQVIYYDSKKENSVKSDVGLRQPGGEQMGGNLACLESSIKKPRCKRTSKSTTEAVSPVRDWKPEVCKRQLHSATNDIGLTGYTEHTVFSSDLSNSQPAAQETARYTFPSVLRETPSPGQRGWNPTCNISWNKLNRVYATERSESDTVSSMEREHDQSSTVGTDPNLPTTTAFGKIQRYLPETEDETRQPANQEDFGRSCNAEKDLQKLGASLRHRNTEAYGEKHHDASNEGGDSIDTSRSEKPVVAKRTTEKTFEGLNLDIKDYNLFPNNGIMQAAVTLTTEFKGSQVHEVIDSKVPQKAVGVRSGSETNDLFSTVEVETETYNEIQKPHLAPRLTFDCRSDEYARVSQSEQLKIELIPQSTPKVYDERKLNLYMLEDPQERPAEESDNYYQSTGLVYLTDEVPRPHLPLELTELHVEDTRSPLNDPELSSPLFSLPSNDEDCIGTDSALRENHYDSDSFSLSELISIENLPVPVLTEQAQISGQPILSGLSTEGEVGRQTVEFIKDVEAITMKSSTDEIRPLHGDEIETACLSVALRSPRMSQENKPAQASYNQPSSQKAGLSFAQGNSDISDAEDIPNWNFYTKTDKEPISSLSMDGTIVKIYHECGIYKRNVCTQINDLSVYCDANGEYFRDLQERMPNFKWLILKERCIGTSPYEPRKEDLSNIDSPVSLSTAQSYGSEIYLLGGELREDERITRIIEALKGLETASQSNASTVASIIEALRAIRGGILSTELFLSRLGSGMGTIIQKLEEKQ